ncbi:PA2778 family cysteine peptidase [Marinobacter sp. S0848L]|uniref:PA2778 family cysteine peptidase n=1 Tax=Marinobacter sp. S0848L TaxID=2926423 RepID=UPI001FF5ED3B|nr:PA2778 family cysteine peptidase [Marinobacter sp. S0848L]MCK0105960.1 PA2778 family cysteine peptidase [Marinobacter sp. S0848L]
MVASGQQLLQDVPFYPQEKYQCGPASLATMLNSQGLSTDPEILKELVYLPGREGSLQVEMVAGARSHNMVVYPLQPNIETLLAEVSVGNPVLVMQNLGFDWWQQWHFAVVVGYDHQEETLILNTDTRKHHRQPYKVFDATWSRAERWAAVILPPDQLPATAELLPWLRAAHDLESTGHTLAAETAYQTAKQNWTDEPSPLLALGNLAYGQNRFNDAANYLRIATERFPEFAEGWNNLAYALSASGCAKQADQAMSCAAKLAGDRFPVENFHPDARSSDTKPSCKKLPLCPIETE